MRIVKLSKDIFPDLESVMVFFRDYLPERNPPGKFRITEGRIAQDVLNRGKKYYFPIADGYTLWPNLRLAALGMKTSIEINILFIFWSIWTLYVPLG